MDTIRAMLREHRLIVTRRGVYGDVLLKTMEALYRGGIRLTEVTFDQKSRDYKETLDMITMLEEHFRGRMAIGVGTVVSPAQVKLAYQVEAAYITSPNTNEAVIHKTKGLGMLFIPEALSPSRVLDAYEYDADYVELFPVARMTAFYIKDLIGPISHMKPIATVGIIKGNIVESAAVGRVGYDISRRLMDRRVIQEGCSEELQCRTETFIVYLQKEEE